LRALLRRANGHGNSSLTFGALHIDLRSSAVTVNGTLVALTPLEYRLIHFLALHKSRLSPRPNFPKPFMPTTMNVMPMPSKR